MNEVVGYNPEETQEISSSQVTVAMPIMSRNHLERLISRSEGFIQESIAAMEAVRPDLDSARAMYEELLQKYREAEILKVEEEKVLDVLVRHRNGYKSSQEIRLLRTTTHLKKKPKVDENGQPLRIPWSELAIEVLLDAKRFMSGDDIFVTIVSRNKEMEAWDKRTNSKYKWGVVHTILKGKQFVTYDHLVGLPEWVDGNKRPDPKYLAQFMMAR